MEPGQLSLEVAAPVPVPCTLPQVIFLTRKMLGGQGTGSWMRVTGRIYVHQWVLFSSFFSMMTELGPAKELISTEKMLEKLGGSAK